MEVAGFARRSLSFFTVVARTNSPRHQVRPNIHIDVRMLICSKKSWPTRTNDAKRFAGLKTVAQLDHSPSSNAAAEVMYKG